MLLVVPPEVAVAEGRAVRLQHWVSVSIGWGIGKNGA